MDNRPIHICDQTWRRKIFWPGGVYYVDFAKDQSDIIEWLFENLKTRNIKITQDEMYEGRDKYDPDNNLKTTAYKIHFRKKIDFIAFKLRWL